MQKKIIVKVSVLGVRGRSGERRVGRNGQTMNQLVQLTLLKFFPYGECESTSDTDDYILERTSEQTLMH